MVQVPPFLKECDRFPSCSVEDREDEESCTSFRRRKWWGRAYELSVSVEAVLQTPGAPRLLFDFLDAPYESCCGIYECVEEDEEWRLQYMNKIVWMSTDLFITGNKNWTMRRNCFLDEGWDHGMAKLYSVTLLTSEEADFWIIQQQPQQQQHSSIAEQEGAAIAATTPSYTSSPPPVVDLGMDTLLRLLAKLRAVCDLVIQTNNNNKTEHMEFPASLDALKEFVGEAQGNRNLCLQAAGLSQAQWNVVTWNCNKNVTIALDYKNDSVRSSLLPEAAILHNCPAKMELRNLDKATADKRQLLLEALASTTNLGFLNVVFGGWNKETFLLFMNAIARNRSIETLWLCIKHERGPNDRRLTLEEWEQGVCKAIASHPTLKDVEFYLYQSDYRIFVPTIEKDDILINMVSQNTVLCTLAMEGTVMADEQEFYNLVYPVLRFNRLRRVVQAIKQETDTEYRQQLFTGALLCNRVVGHAAYRYLLLRENFDLLKQSSTIIEGILLSDWNTTNSDLASLERKMRSLENRKQSLENRMRDRGVVIPTTSLKEDGIKDDVHGRKPKRSRSS